MAARQTSSKRHCLQLAEANDRPTAEMLEALACFLRPNLGLLTRSYRLPHHCDEIPFPHYGGELADRADETDGHFVISHPGGYDLDDSLAILKFLGEAIERQCIQMYRHSDLVSAKYDEIADHALNPSMFNPYSRSQLRRTIGRPPSPEDVFEWTGVLDLATGKKFFVPAQMVYLSYAYSADEVRIFPPISTGAAGGSSLVACLIRGICECIERDAFLIFYLNQLPAPRVDLSGVNNEAIQHLVSLFTRYQLEPYVFDITTDLSIPTFMTLAVDRTGIGPALTVGLKCHPESEVAILGSLLESQHPRVWIRQTAEAMGAKSHSTPASSVRDARSRGIYWYSRRRLRYLDFMRDSPIQPMQPTSVALAHDPRDQLAFLIANLANCGISVYYKDLSRDPFRSCGYHVVKVLAPKLVPLYLDERCAVRGVDRLFTVPVALGYKQCVSPERSLNPVPHPFL